MGGATRIRVGHFLGGDDFNPRSPWGERQRRKRRRYLRQAISIHAPRGGSDGLVGLDLLFVSVISIHAPRGGSDAAMQPRWIIIIGFQSTLPVGGATRIFRNSANGAYISIHAPRGGSDFIVSYFPFIAYNFNPRSPWGERRGGAFVNGYQTQISIHAPRGGSDSR